jgi:hypothetical protein
VSIAGAGPRGPDHPYAGIVADWQSVMDGSHRQA